MLHKCSTSLTIPQRGSEPPIEDPHPAWVFDAGDVPGEFEVAGEACDVDVDVRSQSFGDGVVEFGKDADVIEQIVGVVNAGRKRERV